ncbi:hypothetical protein [Glycomyces buryatensis]|uniref:Uncharacterized protein n=1 Tax=Glycomyces buryatensis TaxID=2570927 RepID=A0A4S8QEI7_9ACTN|nr:hypothetical protein [Glycomyces buryatensis]THV39629.1 hypothetical protein FAB82_17315 [Glycomyces buryatensis]
MSFDEPELPEWIAWIHRTEPPEFDPAGCLRCGGVGYVERLDDGGDRWLAPDGVRSLVPFMVCPDCQDRRREPDEPWIIGDGLR